jgi:hypothetical protein
MSRTTTEIGVLASVFAAVTAIAELLGAANMGTAMAFGAIAFSIALVAIIVKR